MKSSRRLGWGVLAVLALFIVFSTLLALSLQNASSSSSTPQLPLVSFGAGLASGKLFPNETTLFTHTIASGSSFAVMTHFWMTGLPSVAADTAIFRYYVDGEAVASIQFTPAMAAGVGFTDQTAPWGNQWMGKQADNGGWYNNFRIPFQRSIRVTGQLAPGITDQTIVWFKCRGTENLPTEFNGFRLPSTARMNLTRVIATSFAPLQWVPLVTIPSGQGMLFAHVLSVSSSSISFIEGCYHAYPTYSQAFPGLIAGTGTEDYFDSAFTFNAGLYHDTVSGLTHFATPQSSSFELSAYRLHDGDPIFYTDGFRFVWRNGDVVDLNGVKCIQVNGPVAGSPTAVLVDAYTWVYQW